MGDGARFDFYRLHFGDEPEYDPDWLLDEFEQEMETLKGFDVEKSWTSVDCREYDTLTEEDVTDISNSRDGHRSVVYSMEDTFSPDTDAVKMVIAPYDTWLTGGFASSDFNGYAFHKETDDPDWMRLVAIHEAGHKVGLMHTMDWDVMDGGWLYKGDHFSSSSHSQWENDIYAAFEDTDAQHTRLLER